MANTDKTGFFAGLRKKFFPTAREMVDQMTPKTAYPSGRAHWQISKKIASDKTLTPEEKLDLLVEMYAKYYLYQHSKFVTFAVYEDKYEEFVSVQKIDGRTIARRNQGRFEKLYNERLSEQEYIINRELKETAAKILRGADMTVYSIQDDQTRDIITKALRLRNDYSDRLTFNVYCPSREENEMKELLIARYESLHPDAVRTADPLEAKQDQAIPETATLQQTVALAASPRVAKAPAPAPVSQNADTLPAPSKDKQLEQ